MIGLVVCGGIGKWRVGQREREGNGGSEMQMTHWMHMVGGARLSRRVAHSRVAVCSLLLVGIVVLCTGESAQPRAQAQGQPRTQAQAHAQGGQLTARSVLSAQPRDHRAAPFDTSVGAPLPTHRIVAAYGITGGVEFNGPASTPAMLANYLPQLQQLGQQYAALDPVHPVTLAVDLVVNVIQPCRDFPQWCASWTDDATIQAYLDFCQQHNLLLFFDVQLGTEPVSDALTQHLLPYLQRYPFTELALDTEFHFPNTPQGHAAAAGYPCCLGWMDASEINAASDALAQLALQYHLPRKVLVIHQWQSEVLRQKDQIAASPNVSLVLQSDGWGGTENKLADYQEFVQQHLLEYGGYKLFLPHQGDPDVDNPLQSPQDVMAIFPQPLFISYQ